MAEKKKPEDSKPEEPQATPGLETATITKCKHGTYVIERYTQDETGFALLLADLDTDKEKALGKLVEYVNTKQQHHSANQRAGTLAGNDELKDDTLISVRFGVKYSAPTKKSLAQATAIIDTKVFAAVDAKLAVYGIEAITDDEKKSQKDLAVKLDRFKDKVNEASKLI